MVTWVAAGGAQRLPAAFPDAICDVPGLGRILAKTQGMKQFVNDHGPALSRILPEALLNARPHTRTTRLPAAVNAITPGRSHCGPMSPSSKRRTPKVLLAGQVQGSKPVLQQPPLVIDEFSKQRLTRRRLQTICGVIEPTHDRVADVRVADMDAGPPGLRQQGSGRRALVGGALEQCVGGPAGAPSDRTTARPSIVSVQKRLVRQGMRPRCRHPPLLS